MKNLFSFYKGNNYSFLISISLIIYPATVLSISKVNGLIFLLFFLAGLVFLFKNGSILNKTTRNELLFYFSTVALFLVVLLVTIKGGFVYKPIGKYMHLVLIIPVYVFLRQINFKLFFVWYGLVAGSIITGAIAYYEVLVLGDPRAAGIANPILFGDIALMMGCMSLAGIGWFKRCASWQVAIPFLALACGLLASILSGTRGAWLAFPFLVILCFWYMKSRFSIKYLISITVMLSIFFSVIYIFPQTKIKPNVDRVMSSLQQYGNRNTVPIENYSSTNIRLEMWQTSWDIYLDHPFLGVGWGHYSEYAQLQVDKGLRDERVALYEHPHSEYFAALSSGGTLGFLALIQLYLVLIWIFVKNIEQRKSEDIESLSLAGLVLVVGYISFGLTEPILYRSRSINFFVFYLAVLLSAIYKLERKEELNGSIQKVPVQN